MELHEEHGVDEGDVQDMQSPSATNATLASPNDDLEKVAGVVMALMMLLNRTDFVRTQAANMPLAPATMQSLLDKFADALVESLKRLAGRKETFSSPTSCSFAISLFCHVMVRQPVACHSDPYPDVLLSE